MKSIVAGWGVGGLLLSCVGCSFVSEQPPPEVPTHYAQGEKPCKPDNIWNPIADTASTIASVTWVIWANQKISAAESDANAAKIADPYDSHTPDDASYKWARAAGYGGIALFAASAIYGYVIEAQCASYRRARNPQAGEKPSATRHGFPSSVLDFPWSVDLGGAERICRARGQDWAVEGSVGLCQSQTSSAAHPDVELEFELGHPTSIVVIYRSAPQTINENYDQVFADLKRAYGEPQTAAAHVSPACASSLSRCLEAGERPQGPLWSWSGGSIELAPVWQEDHALLELRYKHADAEAE